jgi:cytoskeletal protein CcmA (bactofilin family)
MFALARRGTVIAKGLKIVGSVAAEGLVEVNGQIEGELHCTSLIISRQAHVTGTIAAERVVVDGRVDGPIQGGEVILKSQAHVVGDIQHQSLAIEKGAYFEGRSVQASGANGRERVGIRPRQETIKEIASNRREAVPAA